jgi:L-ornithine Nalpha-acyltransferase
MMQSHMTQTHQGAQPLPRSPLAPLTMGALSVRLAQSPQDFTAVQALRGQRFHRSAPHVPDGDAFDPLCLHLMVEAVGGGPLLATARLRVLADSADFAQCYTAQSYDLRPMARAFGRALEIGRLCLAEGADPAPEVLRALFAGMTALALLTQARVLTGCASFAGADVARHGAALAHLRDQHLGPQECRPLPQAAQSVAFADLPADLSASARDLPPLLRMYLAMGGWVSDFAVIDPVLDTLHVLVAVPVATIPPARLRALGALLGPVALPLA